jgi:hypothetical protein
MIILSLHSQIARYPPGCPRIPPRVFIADGKDEGRANRQIFETVDLPLARGSQNHREIDEFDSVLVPACKRGWQ